MHEMGIAMQIVDIALASVPDNLSDVKLERVNLKVGKLSSVIPDSLRFCFEVITQDTPLAGAQLHIEEVPVKALCKACFHEWIVDGPAFTCPECNHGKIELLSGRELDIVSIEIEDEATLSDGTS